MALISCKECKSKVSNEAYVCPNCGVRLRMSVLGKILLCILAFGLLVVCIAAINTLLTPQYVRDAARRKNVCIDYKLGSKSACESIYESEVAQGKYENGEIISSPSFEAERMEWEEKNKKEEIEYKKSCISNYKSIREDFNSAMLKKDWYGAELKVRRCHELTLDDRYKLMLSQSRSHQ